MKSIVAVLMLALIVGLAAAGYFWRWLDQPLVESLGADQHQIELRKGEAFASLAARLAEQGILEHPRVWSAWARLTGQARLVKAGEYRLLEEDTPASLLSRLVKGEVVTYRVQILEGWTTMQAVNAVAAHGVLTHELMNITVHTLLGALGLPAGHAEGLFFPDTYQFVRGDSDADILRRAYARMQLEVDETWNGRDAGLPYETPYQVLIAASLIEKETGREEDRAFISQVFTNRLSRNMRLQTDPTVIYGLGDRFDGNLKRVHLREDTPYNTYVHRGLPPTPIALPGSRSLHAAAHPEPGDYLFFVSRGDGTSQFSVSLEEHEQAVRRYQLQ